MKQAASPEQVREITRSVLQRREFQENTTGAWIAHALQRFSHWLSKISDWAGAHPGPARILVIVLGVILFALLAHIGYTVISEFLSLRKRSAEVERRYHTLPALEGVSDNWNDAFALARTALEGGDLYRAMWITHRILLSALDLRDLLKFARWKTNSDYLRECRANASTATELPEMTVLRELTGAYDRVIYAHADFDREQATSLVARVEALVREVPR